MAGEAAESDVEVSRRVADTRRMWASVAVEDAAEFCAFVLRDERSGGLIEPMPMHMAWHRLMDAYPRQVIWAHVESGKTQQMSVGRVLYELGRDPTKRIAIVSNTFGQANKIVRTLARYIESSEEYHLCFPNVRPGMPWQGNMLTIAGATAKDPSVQSCGVHGNITGSRLELIILDDILDYENTRTHGLRQDLWDWFNATLIGRLTSWGRVVAIGTAYHPDDLYHRLAKFGGVWNATRFPILNARGESSWPSRWPLERIKQRRVELGAAEFARQMLCKARDDEEARFQREWIDACLKAGEGLELLDALDIVPEGWGTFTGVDLGVSQGEKSDVTSLFTIAANLEGFRQVLNVESGRWSGPEIVRRIFSAHERFHSIVYVENNAAQDFIVQFAREKGALPIRAFTTGKNKAHPEFGVEGIAVEMQNGKWKIPNHGGALDPEIEAWISELLYYDPREHTGDRLMASWFAREGARRYEGKKRGGVGCRIIG